MEKMYLKPITAAQYAALKPKQKIKYLEDMLAIARSQISYLSKDGEVGAEMEGLRKTVTELRIENRVLNGMIDRLAPRLKSVTYEDD